MLRGLLSGALAAEQRTSGLAASYGYFLAIASIASVTALKLLAGEELARDAPFFLYALALIATGWFGNARSALLATALAVLAGWFFFIRPEESFGTNYVIRLGALAFEGLAITAFVARLRAAQEQLLRDIGARKQAAIEREAALELAETAARRVLRLQALTASLAAARTPTEIATILVDQGAAALGATSGLVARPLAPEKPRDRPEASSARAARERAQAAARSSAGAVQAGEVAPVLLEVIAHRGTSAEWLAEHRVHASSAELPSSLAFRKREAQWSEGAAALPLRIEDRTIGVMAFQFEASRTFPAEERALLETFASQAAQAFERAEWYSQEVALRQRLEVLEDLTARLSTAMTREEVASIVIDVGMVAAGADTSTLYVLNETGAYLELLSERGVSAELVSRIQRLDRNNSNPTFRTVETGEGIWAENLEEYSALFPALTAMRVDGPRAQAFWCLPMIAERRAFGVLAMGYYEPRRFRAEERTFVETFTRHCAEALRRAQRLDTEARARASAEKAQSWLATTLHSIGDAVIATNAEGKITLMNGVAERLTGYSEEDARDRSLGDVFRIINEQTRAEVESPVDKVLREGVVVGLASHTVLIGKDGTEVAIDDSVAPIRGVGGAIEGVVLVFRDVTDKKREARQREFLSEAATVLSESLDHEATLARVARLAVPHLGDWCSVHVVEDPAEGPKQVAVAHVDPARVEFARELNRKYPGDPNAKTGLPNVLRTGRSELYPEISDAMLAASAVDAEHLRIMRELGLVSAMVVPLLARGQVFGALTLVSAEGGRRYGAEDLTFVEDLCRRCAVAVDNARLYAGEQHARQAADIANRAKDEFLATVSHELRTPLNAVMGWAKMMASAKLDEAKRVRAVETIERNAVAMAQLIEDLLDVSRIVSGKMRLEVQSVQLSQVVEAAIESVKPAAEAKEIHVSASFDDALEPFVGDPARLQQIVWNLLSNAVKFTPRSGSVEVSVARTETATEIRVKDTGKGIDPRFLPYVFDPFRQERGAQRTRGGLGLGLAITRQLVELHGGRVEAVSPGEGQGATFIVRLPLSPGAQALASDVLRAPRQIRAEASFERPTQLRGLRVLVVDDDEDARLLVKAVLEECGSSVVASDSVDAALEVLAQNAQDVLISDIGMPGQDGYDLIRRVRALPASRGGNIPAAALTAYARGDDRRRVLNAGYTMHIPKPVEPAELVAVVASLSRNASRAPDGGGRPRTPEAVE